MAAHYGFPDQMQQDIDELAANATTAADGGPILPPRTAEGGGVNATGSGGQRRQVRSRHQECIHWILQPCKI